MKDTTRTKRAMGFVLALAVLIPGGALFAADPEPVDLGSAANFGILGGTALTVAAGATIVTGDVGLSPGGGAAMGVTDAQVNGIIYKSDDPGGPLLGPGVVLDSGLLVQAKDDLSAAYLDAFNRTNPTLVPAEIGTLNFGPGLYKFASTASIATGDLTLTGTGGPNDVWIFQIGTTLTVGASITVILANGAQARNVFWQVGTSATFGASDVFRGTIMANDSITIGATSTLEGRALARSGQITFNGTSVSLPPANSAPDGTDKTVTTNEDTAHVFAASDFGFTDLLDVPPNTFLAVKITTLPVVGSLKLGLVSVNVGDVVLLADIPTLTFTSVANGNGAAYASFTFQVQDDGTMLNGGVDLDSTPNTMTVSVTAVNDAPVAVDDVYTVLEDTPLLMTD